MDSFYLSLLLICISLIYCLKVCIDRNYINNFEDKNFKSLILITLSSIFLWYGLTYIDGEETLTKKDYIGFFISIIMGVLMWLRLILII